MVQAKDAGTYLLATGQGHSVRDFVKSAATHLGFDVIWSGSNENEIGVDRKSGKTLVCVDPAFYRPAEVHALLGSAKKAKAELGWEHKVSFDGLVKMMVESDLEQAKKAWRKN